MPSADASTAISRLSARPLTSSSQRAKFGGNMRPRKCAVLCEPGADALPRRIHLRAGVDDVEREQQPRAARATRCAERVVGRGSSRSPAALNAASPGRRRSVFSIVVRQAVAADRRKRSVPPDMPTMRSAKRFASSTSCMLISTGMPRWRAMPASSCMISTEVLGSSDDVGSSASSSRGCCITARGDAHALALTAGKRIGALVGETRQADDVEQLERARDVARRRTCAATRATPTRSPGDRTAGFPSPSAARPGCIPGTPCRCGGARCAQRRRAAAARGPGPRIRSRPTVGSTSRLMQRISVLLPVPDGPMIAVMPRCRDLEVDVGAGPACRRRTTWRVLDGEHVSVRKKWVVTARRHAADGPSRETTLPGEAKASSS